MDCFVLLYFDIFGCCTLYIYTASHFLPTSACSTIVRLYCVKLEQQVLYSSMIRALSHHAFSLFDSFKEKTKLFTEAL